MGAFESSRIYPILVADLSPVAEDLMQHFRDQEFEVQGEKTVTEGWVITVSKGGIFKAVLGMKTALKIEIEKAGSFIKAKAGVGILGRQAVPTIITLFFLWPVLVAQIWGLVKQAKLDEEALNCLEDSLAVHGGGVKAATASVPKGKFCTSCGEGLPEQARFCPKCGTQQVQAS
jgi:ribosomal protein L40E